MDKQKISLLEASTKLGVGTSTLYKWKNRGLIQIIPPQQAGILVSEVDRILADRKEVGSDGV